MLISLDSTPQLRLGGTTYHLLAVSLLTKQEPVAARSLSLSGKAREGGRRKEEGRRRRRSMFLSVPSLREDAICLLSGLLYFYTPYSYGLLVMR